MATEQLCISSCFQRSSVQSSPYCSSLLSTCVVDAITTAPVRRPPWRGHLPPAFPPRRLAYRRPSLPTTGKGRQLRGYKEALKQELTKRLRWCYHALLRQADCWLISCRHTCPVFTILIHSLCDMFTLLYIMFLRQAWPLLTTIIIIYDINHCHNNNHDY